MKSKRIVIDTETTGLDPNEDEILQLSVINVNDGSTIYNQYFKPEKATSWEQAQAVNGISPEMVAAMIGRKIKLMTVLQIVRQRFSVISK